MLQFQANGKQCADEAVLCRHLDDVLEENRQAEEEVETELEKEEEEEL